MPTPAEMKVEPKVERTADDVLNDLAALPEPEETFHDEPEQPPAEVKPEPEPVTKVEEPPKVEPEPKPAKVEEPPPKVEPLKEDEPPPSNKEAAELRVQRKHDRDSIEALERQVRELSDKVAKPEAPRASAEDAFTLLQQAEQTLSRATDDLYGDDLARVQAERSKAERIRTLALKGITEELSPEEIHGVLRKAQAGFFGSISPQIADVAMKYLPVAQQRVSQDERKSEDDEEKQQEVNAKAYEDFQKELERVPELYPDVVKDDSEVHKFIPSFNERWLGKTNEKGEIITEGVFPKLYAQAIIAKPLLHAQLLMESHKASQFDALQADVTKLRVERDQLRRKLGLADVPEKPGGTAPESERTGAERTAQDIIHELEGISARGT